MYFFLLIPCRERIHSVNRPFALVDHELTQILLIFGGRCNHYFWDMRLKIHRLLINFNMHFQFLLTKFSKSKVFRVYRKLITWPTIAKSLPQDWKVNASNGLYSTPKSFSILEPTLSKMDTIGAVSTLWEMSAPSYRDKENGRTSLGTLGVYFREVSAFLRVIEND